MQTFSRLYCRDAKDRRPGRPIPFGEPDPYRFQRDAELRRRVKLPGADKPKRELARQAALAFLNGVDSRADVAARFGVSVAAINDATTALRKIERGDL